MSPTTKDYPANWVAIAKGIKSDARWCCEACDAPYDTPGRVLTVHHLDGDTIGNNEPSNLVALCQVCHLRAEVWLRAGEVVAREACIEALRHIHREDLAQGVLFA